MKSYQDITTVAFATSPKQMKTLLLAASLTIFGASSSFANPIAGLWNTGVDGAGNPNPVGIPETHYSVTTGFALPGGYSFMTVERAGLGASWGWIANPADAAWIGPAMSPGEGHLDNDPVGTYFYDLIFNLDPFSSAEISGFWSSDNSSRVLLNGIEIASSPDEHTFWALHPFSALNPGLFNVGLNTLRFEVVNWPGTEQTGALTGNPSGLLVSGLRGETSVPDGGTTAVLLGLGLLGVAVVRRKVA